MTTRKFAAARFATFKVALVEVALIALTVRVLFALTLAADLPFRADPRAYHFLGLNLADGLGYIRPPQIVPGHIAHLPTAEFPPVFPALLALLSLLGARSPTSQAVAMCCVGTGTVVLIGLVGRRFAGSATGLLAAAIAAIHPLIFQPDGVLMSESPYLLLVAAVLLAAMAAHDDPEQWWRWTVLGTLVGLACLTRAEAVLLVPVLVLPLALRRQGASIVRRSRAALAACLAMTIVVLPWVVRNALEFDRFLPVSTNTGTVVLGSNCEQSYAGSEVGTWWFPCITAVAAIEGKPWRIRADGKSEAEVYDHWRSLGLDYARDHLDALPKVIAVRVLRTWSLWDPSQQVGYDTAERRDRTTQWIGYILGLVLMPLAALGAIASWRRHRAVYVLLAAPIIATLTSIVGYGSTRIRAVAEPSLVVLAATGITWLVWRLRAARTEATPAS